MLTVERYRKSPHAAMSYTPTLVGSPATSLLRVLAHFPEAGSSVQNSSTTFDATMLLPLVAPGAMYILPLKAQTARKLVNPALSPSPGTPPGSKKSPSLERNRMGAMPEKLALLSV